MSDANSLGPFTAGATTDGLHIAFGAVAYRRAVADGVIPVGTSIVEDHFIGDHGPCLTSDEARARAVEAARRVREIRGHKRLLAVVQVAHSQGCMLLWPTPGDCDCWPEVTIRPVPGEAC